MNLSILSLVLLCTFTLCSIFHSCRPIQTESVEDGSMKLAFKSTDGGETWQDISQGLPENFGEMDIKGNSFLVNEKGIFVKVGDELYHHSPNAAPSWAKETLRGEVSSMTTGRSGIPNTSQWAVNLETTNGTSIWSPFFDNVIVPRLRSTFETADGTIFVGTDEGYFKTDNNGKTWKHVHTGSLVGHLAESDGVLLGISGSKIIRSTDNGETWEATASEDGVAFDVKPIEGGFVAITASSLPESRRLSTSYDGGKTWELLRPKPQNKSFADSVWLNWNKRPLLQGYATSITDIGGNLICTLPKGILRSSDKGKTWKLSLPPVDKKVFNLFVSGGVIYAIPTKGGC